MARFELHPKFQPNSGQVQAMLEENRRLIDSVVASRSASGFASDQNVASECRKHLETMRVNLVHLASHECPDQNFDLLLPLPNGRMPSRDGAAPRRTGYTGTESIPLAGSRPDLPEPIKSRALEMVEQNPKLLARVFARLDLATMGRVAQVCKTWRDAAYQPELWLGIVVMLNSKRITPDQFPSLVSRGVTRISLVNLSLLSDVVKGFRLLEALDLTCCRDRLTDQTFSHKLLDRMPHLTELNLNFCDKITNGAVAQVAVSLKNLVTLQLSDIHALTDTALKSIATNLFLLKRLNLSGMVRITDVGIGHLTGCNRAIWGKTVNLKRPSLEVLKLRSCLRLTDWSIKYLLTGQPELVELDLTLCDKITDVGVGSLSGMPALRRLMLDEVSKVTDASLRVLSGAGDLQELSLRCCFGITEWGLLHLAKGDAPIEILNLRGCAQIGSASVHRLLDSQTKLPGRLRSLMLERRQFNIDVLLLAAGQRLTRLVTLEVDGVNKMATALKWRHLMQSPEQLRLPPGGVPVQHVHNYYEALFSQDPLMFAHSDPTSNMVYTYPNPFDEVPYAHPFLFTHELHVYYH